VFQAWFYNILLITVLRIKKKKKRKPKQVVQCRL